MSCSIARDRIKYLCDGNVRGGGFAPPDDSIPLLESVLLDLSEYECDELVTASLDLLTQMYFFEEELFNKANQVCCYMHTKDTCKSLYYLIESIIDIS